MSLRHRSKNDWGRLDMTSELSSLCSYAKGKVSVDTLSKRNYVSTENMMPNKGGIVDAGALPSAQYTQQYIKDDILVSNIRPYFKKIWMADDDGGCSNDVLVFRADRGCDSTFLYYILANDAFFNYASATSKGTKMPRGDKTAIMQYKVPCFNYETQLRIGKLLRSIDDRIAVNKKINDNLQQQAAALFSSLYDRTNTEVRFTDLIQILGGGTPKTGENTYWNGNIAFFTPKDVGTPYTLSTEKTITEEGLSHCNSRLYPVNTVFVTARGTVGKVGMSGVPMAMNQSCYALVGKETHQLLVYFYTLKTVDRLKHKASGAVFDAITTRDFESEQIMKLSDEDAKSFLCIAAPMFQKVLDNGIENQRLSTLRDSLLPKLMSGEIDVSAVQL